MEEQPVTPQGGSRTTLSVEKPMVAAEATASPMPPPGGDSSSSDPARLLDGAVDTLPASYDTLDEEDPILLGDEEEVFDLDTTLSNDHRAIIFGLPALGRRTRARVIQEVLTDAYNNDVVLAYGSSDSEMEGNDEQVRSTDIVSQALTFVGQPARFASYKGFAGFMRLDTDEAPPPAPGQEDAGAIVVHFRYYRFSKTRGGGEHGVEAPDYGTDVHHVRYLVPFPAVAADPASSLRLAGASLVAEAYPLWRRRSYVRWLQALWSGLLAATPVRVPPRATCLVVTVDVGALRREDRTPELMECMRSALEEKARDADASPPVVCGQEQHLPAPVCCDVESSSGEVAPAAKRKRLDVAVAAEVCAICREVMMLEQGLAAWPRCSHAFHGRCLEELLATAPHRCPMCRSTLSITGMFD